MYIGAWQEFQAYNLYRQKQLSLTRTKLQPLFENKTTENIESGNENELTNSIPHKPKPSLQLNHAPHRNIHRQQQNKKLTKLPSLVGHHLENENNRGKSITGRSTDTNNNDEDSIRESVFTSNSEPTNNSKYYQNGHKLQDINSSSSKQRQQSNNKRIEPNNTTRSSPRINSSRQNTSRSISSTNSNNRSNSSVSNKNNSSKNKTMKNNNNKKNGELHIEKKIQSIQKVKALYMQPANELDDTNQLPAVQVAKQTSNGHLLSSLVSKNTINTTTTSSTDTNTLSSSNNSHHHSYDKQNTIILDPSQPVPITDMNLISSELQVISKYFQMSNLQSSSSASSSSSLHLDSMHNQQQPLQQQQHFHPPDHRNVSTDNLFMTGTYNNNNLANNHSTTSDMNDDVYDDDSDDNSMELQSSYDLGTHNHSSNQSNQSNCDLMTQGNLITDPSHKKKLTAAAAADDDDDIQQSDIMNTMMTTEPHFPQPHEASNSIHNNNNNNTVKPPIRKTKLEVKPTKTGLFDDLYAQSNYNSNGVGGDTGTAGGGGGMDSLLNWSLNLKFP